MTLKPSFSRRVEYYYRTLAKESNYSEDNKLSKELKLLELSLFLLIIVLY